MSDLNAYVSTLLTRARKAAGMLALAETVKNAALVAAADALEADAPALKKANAEDVQGAEEAGLSAAMVDRLRLTDQRIADMARGLREVAALPDPVGEVLENYTRPNGLQVSKVRVPIGVVLMIFESRPNVTADAAALCMKSGNAVILRGGKEAIRSNLAIHATLARAFGAHGIDPCCVQMVNTPDRACLDLLLAAEGRIDLAIPRGGEGLIRAVVAKARMPVIKHYKGICHTYVDKSADLKLAEEVCFNAKVQRPAVCNSMETMLVHEAVAAAFLPAMSARLRKAGCELRGCDRSRKIVPEMKAATEEDWSTEYNDLILSVRVVDSMGDAIRHIAQYGSQHSDAIITRDAAAAEEFCRRVDSSGVFVNTSTRFNDGGELGLGCEIGISTDKLHARGPMGLREMTSYKYVVRGAGQVR